MKGLRLANNISTKCLVSGLGHDFVTVYRGDPHGASESWMECHECGMTISELENQEEQCKHEMRCFKCGFPLLKEFRKRPQDNYWDDDPDVKERDLELAIEEVSKETKPYFIDSKGKIQKSLVTNSEKHKLRMKWGNAFKSRENAVEYKIKLMNVLSTKNAVNAS